MNEFQRSGIGMTSQRARDRLIAGLVKSGISSQPVLDVMRHTPRHLFIDGALSSRAYENSALPIGHGQTISQPYIVARMTEALLAGGSPAKVLEVGTGCGYQAAVLAQLVQRVYSVERIKDLAETARFRLRKLGLHNVHIKQADGYNGWPERAPFDAIIATAAPQEIPEALLKQLNLGGRLVIPVGAEHGIQRLCVITRTPDCFERETLEAVSFVPLVPSLKS